MAFQNRQVQYPNRKRLIVKDIVKDSSGNITSLTVDVERAEGVVFVEGTTLTAETLTAEIQSLIEQHSNSSASTATTQSVYDSSTKIATTEFVWDVLTALGFTKLVDSSGSSSDSSNWT